MNFSQRLGLFILIIISVLYVYFSFFYKSFKTSEFNNSREESTSYNPLENIAGEKQAEKDVHKKTIKIFLLDDSGNLKSVKRECDTSVEKSCFEYAIKELVLAPSR